ncbi:MAG: 50S ribosomal protein L25/general stress protein Ctc [Holosporaceae bacterium]|jgi:large subunit ribosomal protein L25|nr:50S ribosomal protein L25/general stress protein Ctc [Holosporaceae bacterium]
MSTVVLEVKPRKEFGTGCAKADRRGGFIPCIIYGDGKEPEAMCICQQLLDKYVHKSNFFSTVFEFTGLKKQGQKFVAKDVQFHPVTDCPIHVDFMRVGKGSRVTVRVPITFVNETASPGLKQGGVLNVLVHEMDVVCDPDNIPASIQVDLAGFEFHHAVHAHDVKLMNGVSLPSGGRNFTIATVVAPTILKKEEETTVAETEETAESKK